MDRSLTREMSERKSTILTFNIEKYGKQLLGFIKSKVRSTEDAEDILQEVWYQFAHLTDIDQLQNISAWLYKVAGNRVVDQYRRKSSPSFSALENEDDILSIKDLLLVDASGDPSLILQNEGYMEELATAIEELPEKQKAVFVQNELQDKTLQEIADESGEHLKTIISRKGYAIKYLRKRLEPIYNELNN